MKQDTSENTYSFEETPIFAETEEETDKKCPACGGVMDYNPEKGNLTCPYCGTETAIEISNEPFVAEELDFNFVEDDESCDWGTATRTVLCKACGAETVYDFNQVASECPYCGSNQIMEQESEIKVMAPGGVVPFQIDAKEASSNFRRWIKGKLFCPNLAKESAKPKSFKGLYLPYWTFDSRTDSSYTGEYGITKSYRDRQGKVRSRTYWYHTAGSHSEFFDDVLVCGSKRQDTSMLDAIEPFDTSKAVEYKPEYLAGFIAERYTIKAKSAWETAKTKIASMLRNHIARRIQNQHGTFQTRNIFVRTSHSGITYKYLLLPIWISSFQYNGKVYHFMINGQTGKVSGQTPISWPKVALAVFLFILLFALIHFTMNADAKMVYDMAELSQMLSSVLI